MLIELDLPYADVRAGDLSLTLGDPPEPAIDILNVRAGRWTVELRLLGCSHQALVHGSGARPARPAAVRARPAVASGGRAELSETVACRPGVPGHLPSTRRARAAGGEYSFSAWIERFAPEGYAARAQELLRAAAVDPLALAGVFPAFPSGPPSLPLPAFTALRARPLSRGATWSTWHGYPQTGELVHTESRLERAA